MVGRPPESPGLQFNNTTAGTGLTRVQLDTGPGVPVAKDIASWCYFYKVSFLITRNIHSEGFPDISLPDSSLPGQFTPRHFTPEHCCKKLE